MATTRVSKNLGLDSPYKQLILLFFIDIIILDIILPSLQQLIIQKLSNNFPGNRRIHYVFRSQPFSVSLVSVHSEMGLAITTTYVVIGLISQNSPCSQVFLGTAMIVNNIPSNQTLQFLVTRYDPQQKIALLKDSQEIVSCTTTDLDNM